MGRITRESNQHNKRKNRTCYILSTSNYPFHMHADSSNLGTGCILIQQLPDRKRIVSANCGVFDKAEQKMSPHHRELCVIISALQTYEFYLIGSPFPIYLFCYHRPILFYALGVDNFRTDFSSINSF